MLSGHERVRHAVSYRYRNCAWRIKESILMMVGERKERE